MADAMILLRYIPTADDQAANKLSRLNDVDDGNMIAINNISRKNKMNGRSSGT